MKNRLLLLTLIPLIALGILAAGCKPSGESARGSTKYHCPMHPTYVSDKPGDCPICNMKLVPIKGAPKTVPAPPGQAAAGGSAAGGAVEYHCPDHPDFIFDKPGECGICGKKLVRVSGGSSPEGQPAAPPEATPGRVTVMVPPEKQQLIGLRTAPVEQRPLTTRIRTSAVAEHDETKQAIVSLRFNGWVQSLKVNYTGQHVHQGEPLMTVYSPELLSAENEYLVAWRQFAQLKAVASAEQRDSAQRLLDSARRRLELWQIGDEEIREIEKRGKASDALLVRSPVTGHVVAKTAVEGRAFMAGETLYSVEDLSHLWLRAAVFESDFPKVHVGQAARVVFPYLGNKAFECKVTFLYPHIDPVTRRGEVRLEIDNPNHEIRPDMWANVEMEIESGKVLVVPASAVIDTGTRQVVFVKREDNHLEPRTVKIGERADDYWQVLDGVKEGEQVVTRALFLVDSESQLKAAIAGMNGEHQH
jgi:membrane fusion protein, copper/silver efflux system